jgi:hypothetical protein
MNAKLLNAHTAPIDGVLPGEVGEFDTANPGVKSLVGAGFLVDPASSAPIRGPSVEEGLALLDEIERLRARVAELEAAKAAKPSKASKPEPTPAAPPPASEG